MALVHRGAAVCLEEKDLTADSLWEALYALVSDPGRMRQMGENARRSAILDADDRILRVVEDTLRQAKREA